MFAGVGAEFKLDKRHRRVVQIPATAVDSHRPLAKQNVTFKPVQVLHQRILVGCLYMMRISTVLNK